MPVGNLMCIVCYTITTHEGVVSYHSWYRRVGSGREGILLRDRIVSLGPKQDHRVFVLSCRLIELHSQAYAQAA